MLLWTSAFKIRTRILLSGKQKRVCILDPPSAAIIKFEPLHTEHTQRHRHHHTTPPHYITPPPPPPPHHTTPPPPSHHSRNNTHTHTQSTAPHTHIQPHRTKPNIQCFDYSTYSKGSLIIGPDKNIDLCTGGAKCNMDKLSLKKGFLGSYYGGQESIDANGKIVSASARGIQISCQKDWQQVKGDKKKIYTCGMVNDLLDGTPLYSAWRVSFQYDLCQCILFLYLITWIGYLQNPFCIPTINTICRFQTFYAVQPRKMSTNLPKKNLR